MEPSELGGTIGAPSKIVINGVEYDPTEAQDFIETGRKTREMEKQYNTSFDKVWPEYNNVSQERAKMSKELDEARAKLSQFETKKEAGTETTTDIQQARAAAKKLGIMLDEDINGKFVSKAELDTYLDQREKAREAVKNVLSTADSLEKEINGQDGRPKFNKKVVMAYAAQYGHTDLKAAYEDMHSDDLKAWQAGQISANKSRGIKTLSGSGKKEPVQPKIDDNNFSSALREALYPGQSEN